MRKVIERARKEVDQAEVYALHRRTTLVQYVHGSVELVAHRNASVAALRVIAKGRLGASFGESPDQEGLLEDARDAAAFGSPVPFEFAGRGLPIREEAGWDQRTDQLQAEDLVSACQEIESKILRDAPDALVTVTAQAETRKVSIATTCGADAESTTTQMTIGVSVPFDKGEADAGIHRLAASVSPTRIDDQVIAEIVEWREAGAKVSNPATSRLPVLLAPQTSSLLTIPLSAGVDGQAVAQGISPLRGRVGEAILSEQITLREGSLLEGLSNGRSFDDEGTVRHPRAIIDQGVLTGFVTDLQSARALDQEPSGNAVRRTLFTEGVQDPPSSWLMNAIIAPGDSSWRSLMAGLDEGILVTGYRGLHSSNIVQGQFTVGVDGFHIVGGKIAGRLERTLVTGNLYEDFLSVAASREREVTVQGPLSIAGMAPYLLVDSLQVSVG